MAVVVAVIIPVAAVAVPSVIVRTAAALAFPVAFIKPLSVMARNDPDGAPVGWTRPVAVMPLVMMPNRIPIARNPDEPRPRSYGPDPNDPGGRRRANLNSDGNLAEGGASG